MNKMKLLAGLLLTIWIMSPAVAQQAGYQHTISAVAGMNLYQRFSLVSSYGDMNTVHLNIKATPAMGLAYDRRFTNWLSLGVAASYNRFQFIADQVVIERETAGIYVGAVDLDMRRYNAAIRPLVHYGHGQRLDMYSGLRMGVNIWKTTLISSAELIPEDIDPFIHSNSTTFNFQIIPFGMRYYLTKNLGLGMEATFGAPYFASFQINYRIL